MVWKIILGIVLFFVIVLAIRVRVTVHSEDGISLCVKWLFLKFNILPKDKNKPKKEKKKKKKKEKKPKEEKKDDETEEKPKEEGGKENIFLRFYHNNGVSGVVDLLKRLVASLKSGMKRIGRAFLFEEIYVSLLVGEGDSAAIADKYAKTCAEVFPAMGFIVSTMRVKKYSVDVNPDFIYGRSNARLHVTVSVRPLRLINAFIALGFSLVFKVLIKFLKGSRAKKPAAAEEVKNIQNNN